MTYASTHTRQSGRASMRRRRLRCRVCGRGVDFPVAQLEWPTCCDRSMSPLTLHVVARDVPEEIKFDDDDDTTGVVASLLWCLFAVAVVAACALVGLIDGENSDD